MFRFAISVHSCCGEGGALQADIAVCGEHSPCSGHTGFAPYRGVCAFPVYTAQAPGCSIWSEPCVECGSSFRVFHKSADSVAPACCLPRPQRFRQPGACACSPGRGVPFPSAASSHGPQRLGALSPGAARLFPPRRAARASRGLALSPRARRAFSLRGPSARCRSGLRKSLDRNRGLPWKTMGCFSGRLMSAASDQKLFCKLCSPFCCSFDEFVQEKVISPSYSSAIF